MRLIYYFHSWVKMDLYVQPGGLMKIGGEITSLTYIANLRKAACSYFLTS